MVNAQLYQCTNVLVMWKDDVSAHSELGHLREGPLAPLWDYKVRHSAQMFIDICTPPHLHTSTPPHPHTSTPIQASVGPLVCPEMGASLRELRARLTMEPPPPRYSLSKRKQTRLWIRCFLPLLFHQRWPISV